MEQPNTVLDKDAFLLKAVIINLNNKDTERRINRNYYDSLGEGSSAFVTGCELHESKSSSCLIVCAANQIVADSVCTNRELWLRADTIVGSGLDLPGTLTVSAASADPGGNSLLIRSKIGTLQGLNTTGRIDLVDCLVRKMVPMSFNRKLTVSCHQSRIDLIELKGQIRHLEIFLSLTSTIGEIRFSPDARFSFSDQIKKVEIYKQGNPENPDFNQTGSEEDSWLKWVLHPRVVGEEIRIEFRCEGKAPDNLLWKLQKKMFMKNLYLKFPRIYKRASGLVKKVLTWI